PVSVVERGRPCATAEVAKIRPIPIARPAMSATARRPMMSSLLELPAIHRSFPSPEGFIQEIRARWGWGSCRGGPSTGPGETEPADQSAQYGQARKRPPGDDRQ